MISTLLSWIGGIAGLLFVIFLILKLVRVGRVEWSWVWTSLIIAIVVELIGWIL